MKSKTKKVQNENILKLNILISKITSYMFFYKNLKDKDKISFYNFLSRGLGKGYGFTADKDQPGLINYDDCENEIYYYFKDDSKYYYLSWHSNNETNPYINMLEEICGYLSQDEIKNILYWFNKLMLYDEINWNEIPFVFVNEDIDVRSQFNGHTIINKWLIERKFNCFDVNFSSEIFQDIYNKIEIK